MTFAEPPTIEARVAETFSSTHESKNKATLVSLKHTHACLADREVVKCVENDFACYAHTRNSGKNKQNRTEKKINKKIFKNFRQNTYNNNLKRPTRKSEGKNPAATEQIMIIGTRGKNRNSAQKKRPDHINNDQISCFREEQHKEGKETKKKVGTCTRAKSDQIPKVCPKPNKGARSFFPAQ